MWKSVIAIILTVAALSMSGCLTYPAWNAARGIEEPNRPEVKDIYPFSASSDGKYIRVCFRVEGKNEAIYTAEAPDPDGPEKKYIYASSYFDVRSFKKGCRQHGQSINVHPLTGEWPIWDVARGIYPQSDQKNERNYYRFLYRNGAKGGVEIRILEADQFKRRVNAHPVYYLAVPFTLVGDIVATPLFVLWMAWCDSCK